VLEWSEYLDQLLMHQGVFDDICISFGGDQELNYIPPIIKASILMLDQIQEHQGRLNILVFPERVQSIFIFTLVKLLHNINEDKVKRDYNPESFSPGDKLKLGNAVAEFMCVKDGPKGKCLELRLSDLQYTAPMEFLPLFQKTDTNRRLSKSQQLSSAIRLVKGRALQSSPSERLLTTLADYKTHMDSSIFYMTSIINTKEVVKNCWLCEHRVSDVLLIGRVDYSGEVKNIGAGQLAGTPAIVLASDMYAIASAAEKGHPIQSIIMDVSNSSAIMSQVDVLDDLVRWGVPITCVTDTANSFDLKLFKVRNFNIWRWDESSITSSLYDVTSLASDRKIKHCATRSVEYLRVDGYEASDAIKRLYAHKSEFQDQSAQMMRLFGNLYSLAFTALRETAPFTDGDLEYARSVLTEGRSILESEKAYLSPVTYDDYKQVVHSLDRIFASGYQLMKQKILAEQFKENRYEYVCIIVPERFEKRHVQNYWQVWCKQNGLATTIQVLYSGEYYQQVNARFSVVVVVGWLKRAIMRKILYSFSTPNYIVLLYDYECRWKNYDLNKWHKELDSSSNKTIIKRSLSSDQNRIFTSRFVDLPKPAQIETATNDELNEVEQILRDNKYRQYEAKGGSKPAGETTDAIPVNYVGGYMAFYRTGHKVVCATKIITDDAEKIDTVLPEKLQVGDFVVVREADRDLIKEMADIILESIGKNGLREMAEKWKEALKIELAFSSPEEIYQKLSSAGCARSYPTVRSWLFDEDVISPQQKQDLQHIAAITENGVLSELLDQVHDAAQEVKAAHVQAGRLLSEQLRIKIVEALENYGDIDPFNIWEPIEMNVDGIGIVRILKIIDIGPTLIVDTTDTNRLIEE
jgi:hypothetical protein